jgi:hypothetical protein
MLKGLVLAVAGFVLFLIVHIVIFRLIALERRFKVMVQIMLAVGLGFLIVHWATGPDLGFLPLAYARAGWAIDLLNGLLVYGFLFIGYSMFYFLVDRGFSGRIMIEIETAPECRLRQQDIAARYSLEMVLRRRLTEMLEIGQVVQLDGRYCNTSKGRSAAAMLAFVKRFLQLGEGG